MKPRVRTAYDRERVSLAFVDEDGVAQVGRTKQCFKKECDIHEILKQYKETGLISHLNQKQEMYGDFIVPVDYQESLAIIEHAQKAFMDLPATVRKRFKHDPHQFLEFLSDDSNQAEALSLGLAVQPKFSPAEPERSDSKAPADRKDERSEE